jgi:hypothetical protein
MGFKSSKLYLSVKSLVLFLPLLGTTLVLFQNCSRSQFALQGADQLNSNSSLSAAVPSIVLNQDIPALTNQSSITTSFSVVDDTNNQVKSIVCELDGPNSSQVVKDCSAKTVSFTGLVDGDYTLSLMLNSTPMTTSSLQPQASGNLYTVKRVFRKDNTPPVISVSSTPPSATSSLTAQFVFTVTDNLSGVASVQCSLDNAAFSSCVSGTTLNVAVGAHNYQIKATDNAGNTSQAYSYSWTVSAAAIANITLSSNVTSPTKSGSATFTFSSSASGSTYQCSVDNAAFASCSSPNTLSAAEGSHSFSVKGIDSSGASSSVSTFNWVVDQTAPSTPSILSNLVSPSKNNQVSYSFSSTDAVGVASYQCSQDGTTFATCTSPKAYTLTDGTKSFYVKASDAAGNVSGVARLDLVIDTVAPVIAITSTQSTTNLSGNITFTITENGSGINKIQCSLDGSAFASCTSPYAYTVAAGSHNFQVQANDLAGNVSATMTSSWTISAPAPSPSPSPTPAPSSALTGLHVVMGSGGVNGHIVNGAGQNVQFHGVNHTYTEDSCTTAGGGSFSDGHLTQVDLDVMKQWKINIIRVPLNEDCWLGINGVPFGGSKYQAAVQAYVNLITSNGMAVILDLHWAAPGTTQSQQGLEQVTMADSDHALTFWSQVAAIYASKGATDTSTNSMILFDLFNEPYIGSGTAADWNCWLSGGCNVLSSSGNTIAGTNGSAGTTTGMAQMLQAVRNAAGSPQNVVMMGGLGYSHDLSSWVNMVNSIPSTNGTSIANVVASWHIYSDSASYNNYQYSCPNQWNNYSGTCPSALQTAQGASVDKVLAAGFPVLIGETGINYDANSGWWDSLLTWMDGQGQGYLSWTWNTDAGPFLLTTWNYPSSISLSTITSYTTVQGQTYYKHLQQSPTPSPSLGGVPTGVQLLLQGQDTANSTSSNTPPQPNHILLGWKSVTGATSYNIYRSAHPGVSTPPYTYSLYGSITAATATSTYNSYVTASKANGSVSPYGGTPYQTNVDSAYQDTAATNCVGAAKGSPNSSNLGEYFNTLGTAGGYDPIGYTYKVTAVVNGVESNQSDDSIMIYFAGGNRIMNTDIFNGPISYADTTAPIASPLGYTTNAVFSSSYINPFSGNGSAVANLNLKGYNYLVISLYTNSSNIYPVIIPELSGDQPVFGSTPYNNGILLAPFTASGVSSPATWALPMGQWTTFKVPISSYYQDALDTTYPNAQQYSFYKITLSTSTGPSNGVWVEWYWSVN